MKHSIKILAFSLSFVLFGCKEKLTEHDIVAQLTSFKWVKEGNTLTFDYLKDGQRTPNFRGLRLEKNSSNNLVFREFAPNEQGFFAGYISLFENVVVTSEGLTTTRCSSCEAHPCFASKRYLKVPIAPYLGQELPVYACANKILFYEQVIAIDSSINVPFGTFKTTVIFNPDFNVLLFWNEENGLIRFDGLDTNQASSPFSRFSLELSDTNYK